MRCHRAPCCKTVDMSSGGGSCGRLDPTYVCSAAGRRQLSLPTDRCHVSRVHSGSMSVSDVVIGGCLTILSGAVTQVLLAKHDSHVQARRFSHEFGMLDKRAQAERRDRAIAEAMRAAHEIMRNLLDIGTTENTMRANMGSDSPIGPIQPPGWEQRLEELTTAQVMIMAYASEELISLLNDVQSMFARLSQTYGVYTQSTGTAQPSARNALRKDYWGTSDRFREQVKTSMDELRQFVRRLAAFDDRLDEALEAPPGGSGID